MEHRKQQTNDLVEHRYFNIEHRASDEGEKKIGGMAAVYDSPTNMGWFVEIIKKGFFDSIRTDSTACLKNHDPNLVLGRTKNGSLKLNLLETGLEYECTLPKTSIGADAYEEVRSGFVYESSFAFTVAEQQWRRAQPSEFAGVFDQDVLEKLTDGGMIDVRELIRGNELYDVSPVTYPAYKATSVSSRDASPLFEVRNKFLGISSRNEENTLSATFTNAVATVPASISGEQLVITLGNGMQPSLRSFVKGGITAGDDPTDDEERMKIKVEVEVECNEHEMPETEPEMPDEAPTETDAALYARQRQVNLNRLRIAQAMRSQIYNSNK